MPLTRMERAALEHVQAWHRYQNSPEAARDRARDKAKRAAADRQAGHVPACTLARCAATCPSETGRT